MVYPSPMQSFKAGKYFLSFNYDSLEIIRPDYGYKCKGKVIPRFADNKILYIPREYGDSKELVDINHLHDKFVSKKFNVEECKGKFNHILISPDGQFFIFLYRYFLKGERHHKLFKFDFKTNLVDLILSDQVVSHYCWDGLNNLLFWGIVNSDPGYFILDLKSLELTPLIRNIGDGHPGYLDEYNFITDTYPNNSRLRKLLIINIKSNKIEEILSVFQPVKFRGETRCDPHPSICHDKRFLQIDTVFSNRRQTAIIDFKNND